MSEQNFKICYNIVRLGYVVNKAILISDNSKLIDEITNITASGGFAIEVKTDIKSEEELIEPEEIGVVIFDAEFPDIISTVRNLKFQMQSKDIRSVIILPENNINYDCLKYVNSYITRPLDANLALASFNAAFQLRETFRGLSKNNSDLAKSLYQLNVLYSTSTQLAGSLDKTNLIEIMTDGLDRSLSVSLCYALVLNEVNDIQLIIKSLFPISSKLENAIKLRALLSYKNLFSINPKIEDIRVIKSSKDQYGEYDLNLFGFDNLFAPINIKNKFYGVIEIFRETDFMPDDTKCFTTLVKQVSLPLESAILYEEIKDTNMKLERLERLKSEFISIVSHELKTPLTSINSSLDIILKGMTGEINETTEKFLNLAKSNVKRLSAIIYDLLDLSKIEAGKMEFRFERTNINIPVELVKNTLENLAKEQNISIKMNLARNVESVYIDTQRMEQVLTNLISNAIKFTKENGEIEVSSVKINADEIRNNPFFETLPDKMSKEYIKIAVRDNGIGIAEENKYKVFEQFKQIENSLSRKVGGSGLGLPIAKRLIEAHKGFIWLDSELNVGSTFYIAIPIMNDEEVFEISLEQDIQKAKQDHINIMLIGLKESVNEKGSLIDKICDEDILRKTSNFNELMVEKEGNRYYYLYCVDVDSFVYDFEVRKLETYIKNARQEYPEYDIVYSSAICPHDSESAEELIFKLNDFKGDINEKDTDS